MIDAALAVLSWALGLALTVAAVGVVWWTMHGRRESERETWRREMRVKRPRR